LTLRDSGGYTVSIQSGSPPLKLGLDSYSYHYAAGLWEYTPRENPPMTVEHYLQKASELGLDGVHLCDPRHLESIEYGYVTGLRDRAQALNLYLELGTGGTNPDHLRNMIRAAHVLGSQVVRTFVGRERPTSADAMDALLAEAAADLVQVVPLCERYHIHLAIENHQDLTSDELLSLLDRIGSDWVGVCFDTGNPLALLEDPLVAAEALAPVTKTVHLKDYQLAAQSNGFSLIGCALGEGVVNLPAILEVLSSTAPSAALNIECYLGKHPLPVLEEDYLARVFHASAVELGRTLRLVRDQGLPRMPRLPLERGVREADLLAAEDDLVLRSVRWAQQALGRPAADFGEDGERTAAG